MKSEVEVSLLKGREATTQERRLEESHRQQLSRVLAEAFHDDPLYAYFIPDQNHRSRTLPECFRIAINYSENYGQAYACKTGEQVNGAALWLPSGDTLKKMIMAGMWKIPSLVGISATKRLLDFVDHTEGVHNKYVGNEKHYYLGFIGVKPSHQRTGIGSALLQPVLSLADKEGVPCYLEITNRGNETFYNKHGFYLVGKHVLPRGALTYWSMLRAPQQTSKERR